eukprot:5953159-Pyramimonas_sp.AAC.2
MSRRRACVQNVFDNWQSGASIEGFVILGQSIGKSFLLPVVYDGHGGLTGGRRGEGAPAGQERLLLGCAPKDPCNISRPGPFYTRAVRFSSDATAGGLTQLGGSASGRRAEAKHVDVAGALILRYPGRFAAWYTNGSEI